MKEFGRSGVSFGSGLTKCRESLFIKGTILRRRRSNRRSNNRHSLRTSGERKRGNENRGLYRIMHITTLGLYSLPQEVACALRFNSSHSFCFRKDRGSAPTTSSFTR